MYLIVHAILAIIAIIAFYILYGYKVNFVDHIITSFIITVFSPIAFIVFISLGLSKHIKSKLIDQIK